MIDPDGAMSFAALEKHEWSKEDVARSYAEVFATASDMVAPYIASAVRAGQGSRALDLCCGHGNVSASLVEAGANVTGLDFSAAMLDLARRSVPKANFIKGDAMNLAFDGGTFDAVTIGFGIPHVPAPPRVFCEARRVLRPGGRFAFSIWCGPEVDSALGYVFTAIGQHGHPDISLPPGPGAHDYADPDFAFAALHEAGFKDCQIETVAAWWQMDDPGAPFDYVRDGAARGGALLRPQPEQNANAIRNAVIAEVTRNHGDGPYWQVPIPAVVVSATTA